MRGRRALVVASIGVILLAMLVVVGSSVLHLAHFGWPAWAGVAIAAVAGILASPGKKALDVFFDWPLGSFSRALNRSRLIRKVPGYRMKVRVSTDRIVLNIHPAIPLSTDAPTGLSDEFPLYVERDMDADVRAWIKSRSARGCMIIMVGPAASGKTRLLSEAFKAELPDWQLLRPSSRQLNALVEANASLARSVLWLDELQTFFEGDPLRSATVEALLAGHHGPVILAATIRSEERARLLGKIATGDREISVNANTILRMPGHWSGLVDGTEHAVQFDVPGQFSNAEQVRASVLSSIDPRLDMALHSARDGDFTATLACEAELIDRWRGEGDRNGQAVITAAIVARLCGHPEPIGEGVLAAVTLSYLSSLEAAPENTNWLPGALRWAQVPVFASRGTSAIRAVRTRPGHIDGYRVSDILLQDFQDHDYPEVRQILDAEGTWRLILRNAPESAAAEIALSAYKADKFGVARDAWLIAASRGDAGSARSLGLLFWEHDLDAEAERWLRRAVELGNISAMISLADWLSLHDQAAEAGRLLDSAAYLGDPDAMRRLGFHLGGQGDLQGAEDWTRKAAELGNVTAMTNLGYRLAMRGENAEAEEWSLKAARLGFPGAMQNLGDLYRDQGNLGEALVWYTRAAERAYADVMANRRRFRPWPGEGRDDGTSNAMLKLAELLQQTGQGVQAEEWYHRGVEIGDARAAAALAVALEARGDPATAMDWRQRAAMLAEANLARNHSSLRNAYGEPGLRRNTAILVEYADYLIHQDNLPEAEKWYRLAASFGDQAAIPKLP
jgi:TPR repeat protein